MKTVTTPSPSGNREKRMKANLFANDNPEELELIRQHPRDIGKRPLRVDAHSCDGQT